jgi:cytoskeletal protein RodZ
LPWLLIATVVGVGVWMVVDYLGRSGSDPQQVAQESPSPEEASEPEESPEPEEETPTPDEATPTPKEEKTPKPPKKLITEGISVQVLNGTSDPEASTVMSEKLAALGYQIVALETSTSYKETTVFWSFPDAERAAKALAAKFGWVADEKPGNLADTVSLHVVVGKDEI